MPGELSVTVHGLVEARNKMNQVARDLHGDAMIDAFEVATMMVTRDARTLAPVDNGPLRASILPEVRVEGKDVIGIVGSNKTYAPYMELGTGIYVGRSPYFPPPSALEVWARRHGTTGFAVALAIFRAGGTKPRKFLQTAVNQNRDKVITIIERAVGNIIKK